MALKRTKIVDIFDPALVGQQVCVKEMTFTVSSIRTIRGTVTQISQINTNFSLGALMLVQNIPHIEICVNLWNLCDLNILCAKKADAESVRQKTCHQ